MSDENVGRTVRHAVPVFGAIMLGAAVDGLLGLPGVLAALFGGLMAFTAYRNWNN